MEKCELFCISMQMLSLDRFSSAFIIVLPSRTTVMGFSIKQHMEALLEKGFRREGRQNATETSMEAGCDSLGSFPIRLSGILDFLKNTIKNQPRFMILWLPNSWMRRELYSPILVRIASDCGKLCLYPEGYEPSYQLCRAKTSIPKEEQLSEKLSQNIFSLLLKCT